MLEFATGSYLPGSAFLFFVFYLLLCLRGASPIDALWLPLGGLAWSAALGAIVAIPLMVSRNSPFESAFETAATWTNLLVVPIYVWRRVPEALIPRLTLSELLFWNVTATALSFGAWAGKRMGSEAGLSVSSFLLWGAFFLVWLWPSFLALILRKWAHYRLVRILSIPLTLYFWVSLLYWLLTSLLTPEPEGAWIRIRGLAAAVFEAFAAIQCFAIIYLVYYIFFKEDVWMESDEGTRERVGEAVMGALKIDEWRPLPLLSLAVVYGLAIVAFTWANAARGWNFPVYLLLLLPYIISETIAEMSKSA